MTHIENILPEMVGGEVQRLLVSDADGLAAAALYDLVRKATGCRLPQPDGTPSSEVEEMLALCSAVLRRHWQTPLTMLDGLSLQELVSRLMADRMVGNATLGIPAVNGSVTEALSALLDRKITGAPEVADGMSLVQLLCGSAASASLTTLTDPTTGWTMDKAMPWSSLPNLQSATLGCADIVTNLVVCTSTTITNLTFANLLDIKPGVNILNRGQYAGSEDTILNLPALQTISKTNNRNFFVLRGNGKLLMPSLKDINLTGNEGNTPMLLSYNKGCTVLNLPELNCIHYDSGSSRKELIGYCDDLEEIIAPKLTKLVNLNGTYLAHNCPNIRKVVLGALTVFSSDAFVGSDNLIHYEVGEGTECALSLSNWSPTTALSSNLLQFLSNFREFLFLRLADRTGQTALTLTLSSAVYAAITGTDTTTTALTLTLNQLGITDLTDKETQAGITLNTTYATWLETYRDAINWNIGYV